MGNVRKIDILGVKVDMGYTVETVMEKIERDFLTEGCHYVCTTNPEFIMDSQKNLEFRDLINYADLSLPDGSGVVMADYYLRNLSRVRRPKLRTLLAVPIGIKTAVMSFFDKSFYLSKITGVSLCEEIFKASAKKNYSVFLLGGKLRSWKGKYIDREVEDMANIAADNTRKKFPGVNIVGATSSFSKYMKDDDVTVAYIKECMSKHNIKVLDCLLVAYGAPEQEKWIKRNISKIPCHLAVGVGGTFDYFSEVSKKPNEKVVQYNVEWLFRLLSQPWRFSRIIKAFPLFPLKVFFHSLKTILQ